MQTLSSIALLGEFLKLSNDVKSENGICNSCGESDTHDSNCVVGRAEQLLPQAVTELADLFESILTDQHNSLCEPLWAELQKRGWDMEQSLKGTLV